MDTEMSTQPAEPAGDALDATPPNARLIITRMELINFKSYFGKVVCGPFDKCFTSVVGPNGSGKSNVIDAMLFVFGFRATKIRQGKLSGLIHNSENHSDVESCSVSVHFQMIVDNELNGGEGYTPVEGSEVVVKREVRKDNSSTYYYNGKKIAFKDLAQNLRQLGIDLDHNRFLILQGEVEAISMMPPKGKVNEKGETTEEGMLEYLEDIIGSNVYIEDINRLSGQVEELNTERAQRLAVVKIVEKEKDELEGGKEEAEAYLKADNDIILKKNELFQAYAMACKLNDKEASEKYEVELAKLNEAQQTLKAKEAEMATHEKNHSSHVNDLKALAAAAQEAKNKFSAYERRDAQLGQNDKDAKSKMKKLDKALQQGKTTVSEISAKISALEEDEATFTKDLADKEVQLVKEEDRLTAIQAEGSGERAALKEKLDAKETELEPLTAAVDKAQSVVDLKQQELDLLTGTTRQLATQLEEAKTNFATAQSTEADRTKQIKALQTRQATATTELKSAEKELSRIAADEAPLVDTVRSKRARVEEAKSAASSARSQSKVFKTLMELNRPGVYGRLGSLGAIDDKYDCAITTACGALNYLVCDTIATAQWCINYLKKHNVGRVTCICLDKQQHLQDKMTAPFAAPAGTERLFDLVRVQKDDFRVAFYYALRNTLVAPDLDTATKVAYSKKGAGGQVVTLEGQLISTSGTMAGGGNKAARGGMSATLGDGMTPQEISKLEKSLEDDVASLGATRNRKLALEQSVKTLSKEMTTFDTNLRKMRMDIDSAKKALPELEALIDELTQKQAATVSDSTKINTLESALKKDTKILDAAKAAAAKVEAQKKEIEDAIANVGGIRLKAQKSKVKSLSSQMDKLRSSITKAGVEMKTAKTQLKKAQSKLEKDEAELEKTVQLRAEIKAELADMDGSAKEVLQHYQEAKTVLEDKEAEMKAISKAHTKLEAECNKLRGTVIDLEETCKAMKATVKENQQKMKSWQGKVAKLKLHKIGSDYFDDEDTDEGEANEEPEGDGPSTPTAGNSEDTATQAGAASKKKATLTELSEEYLATVDVEQLEYDINILEEKLGKKKHNAKAITDYYAKENEYINKVTDLDAITEKRDGVRAEYESMRKARLEKFFAGFKIISTKLKEMYQMITLGGDAELEYVDNINPFSEGIVFSVRPPRKSWKAIQNLSGGEKTLSSLALVFALHHFKPTPLYVMDEIDAALDFKNVSIVAHYIKERTKNAQFIIISLRNNMFELADRLVGIYKTDNCTKTVTINPHSMAGTTAVGGAPATAVKIHANAPAVHTPAPLTADNH
eukprot:m.185960 g.185960  ORF g.185960 m.185960 type:complete len:1307 (+) comp16612_c0_seq1:91-4011(+)